ncbi:ExbD/TolR family protein [Bizionia myxarmorum]|uniref:Biopolymer transporter ExbD n=1 Tax=Bizionia myxarmorum TaxID=291186 RepID=A0A5D0RAE3_9FLAO|nr:biopolymer transporter ExbD [Bizionia myxarmorum]TYB78457.1 biopolymer transporter ExbD [Bizionia myxarmorum]
MSKFKKKKGGEMPAVNTASLPDIVFMLLFFFMVATVMRKDTLKIKNSLPAADQVEKLAKRNLLMYIYAGKPSESYKQFGSEARIQLNDKFADVSEIPAFIAAERADKREEEVPFLTTVLSVDKDTNMGLVSDVKQKLREVNALKINYKTRKGNLIDSPK